MSLFTRYVLREVGLIFLITLSALTIFMLVIGVGKEALTNGLGPMHLALLLPYLLPNALMFAIPATILLATSMVYGRMSSFGEVIAVKSLGISPMSLVWPTLVLATGLSLLTVWLNDKAVSWGYEGTRTVVLNSLEDIILGVLNTNRSYATKMLSITVKGVEGRKLIEPVITFQTDAESPQIMITCEEAEFRSVPNSGVLTIICRNGSVDMGATSITFDEIEREIPLDEVSGKVSANISPAHVSLADIPARIAKQRINIEKGRELLAAQAAYSMMTGNLADLGGATWKKQATAVEDLKNNLYRLQTEPPRRWANGFSCLCFTLVGIPLAIRMKNSDVMQSFFACFGPILLVYYPLMMFGVDRAKDGALPPMIVWLANGILIICGLWLLRRVVRY